MAKIVSGSPNPVKANEPDPAETVPGVVDDGPVLPPVRAPSAGVVPAAPPGLAPGLAPPPVPGLVPGLVPGPVPGVLGVVPGVVGGSVPGVVGGSVPGVVGGTVTGGGGEGGPAKVIGAATTSWPVSTKTRAHFTPRTCWTGEGGHG